MEYDLNNKPSLDCLYNSIFNESDSDEYLEHVGRSKEDGAPGPGSGRYPLGSGKNPNQHSGSFLSRVEDYKKQGMSESEIALAMGILNREGKPSSTRLRVQISLAKSEERTAKVARAKQLREEGYSLNQIAEKMGFKNDSSVRSLLNEKSEARMNQARKTADFLKKQVDEKGMIDVGAGVELSDQIRVSREKMKEALYILELEGYPTYAGRFDQTTNATQKTTRQVLCPPGTKHKEIFTGKIDTVDDYVSMDGGETFKPRFKYPDSLDSKRLNIRYAEEGGLERDGLIEIRRGVKDLDLGENRYCQARILVDGTHYIKGMAIYGDDKNFPPGKDIIFNTNKAKGTDMKTVLKEIKKDPENPFGSTIKAQSGLINMARLEGDVGEWKDKLPAQFLSKQSLKLANRQLKLAIDEKKAEYDEISSLTNPTVKKRLLDTFANDCDSAAVHLYAAALPRQKHQNIIPIPSMKDNEVYAPNYNNGEKLALVRFPHGGTFEIPILTVNNKHKLAKEILGNSDDAVGINSKVAERLSGADFDGDTVMCIPHNSKIHISSRKQLDDLEGFDPKMKYGTETRIENGEKVYYNQHGQKIKVMNNTQNEMGRISNLITDMTIRGANDEELARAVKHSMVVIDAEKHKLDYRQSAKDNRIDQLKRAYQEGGASTIISRAKNEKTIYKTQGSPHVNMKGDKLYDPTRPEGALVYKIADDKNLYKPKYSLNKKNNTRTYTTIDGKKIKIDMNDKQAINDFLPVKIVDKETGKVAYKNRKGDITYAMEKRTQKTTQMADTDDAYTLVSKSDTHMERLYANYANTMKALANTARKDMKTTGDIKYSASAKKAYPEEVASLVSKLNNASKNAPRERVANDIANSAVKAMMQDNPDMSKEQIKKKKQQEIQKARDKVGAHRQLIEITPKEWEAIQAGAISPNQLNKILKNTDIDVIRSYATPRKSNALTNSQISRAKSMSQRGYTNAEIAAKLGVSASTISKYL